MKAYKVVQCLEQNDFDEEVLGIFTFERLKELGAKLVEKREHFSEKIGRLTEEENFSNVDELVTTLVEWDIIDAGGYFPRDMYDTLEVIEIEIED